MTACHWLPAPPGDPPRWVTRPGCRPDAFDCRPWKQVPHRLWGVTASAATVAVAAAVSTMALSGLELLIGSSVIPILLAPVVAAGLSAGVRVVRWRSAAAKHKIRRAPHVCPQQAHGTGIRSPEPPATIGIVTALPEEFTAIRSLLDGTRERRVCRDRAAYVAGTLPSAVAAIPHEVVLTLTTKAGTDAAATACSNLGTSFPSVNCVIMAGIAAGVPNPQHPKKHVRLGDVVVAAWGIIDYDHVDETVDGSRPRGGFPTPSPLLTAAARLLQANELGGQRPWERWLDITTKPALACYARPDDDTDVLYASDDSGRRLRHPDRAASGHRPGQPKVHYGRVGSADRSLRNQRVRDAFAAQHDVRAFEMEGTGIGNSSFLNGLEWFVVRGISDYGDSRADETWRTHAAMAAAAYVRALLAACSPLDPRGGHPRGGPADAAGDGDQQSPVRGGPRLSR